MDFATIESEHGDVSYPFLHYVREYLLAYPALFVTNRAAHVSHTFLTIVPGYLLGVATDALVSDPDAFSILLVPDAWLPGTREAQFLLTVGLLAGVVVASSAAGVVDMLTQMYLHELSKHDLRTDAYDATQRLGLEFFDDAQTGDVMSVLDNDVETYSGAYRDLLNKGTWRSVRLSGRFGILLLLHWQFALVLLGLVLPAVGLLRAFDRRIESKHADVRSLTGRLNARIENSVSGIATVKTTASEARECERVSAASRERRDAAWAVEKTRAVFEPVTGLFTNLTAVVTFVLGAWWAATGPPAPFLAPLSLGAFVTFFYYSRSFTGNVENMVDLVDAYREFRAAADRVNGLFAAPVAVPEPDDPVVLDAIDGHVEYESVTFGYGDDPIVRDVNVEIEPGEFVGVVGPTGAGKTTLLKLLVRFYDPDEGRVRVDGHDLRDLDLTAYRRRIGYVSQEPHLFDDSVRANITYGNPDADEDAVVAAAERANAHEFVTDLAEGYDTLVGERGVKLSGGQRQRIAIARAILKDPDLLVLDEATSHVDARTELLVQDALEEVIEGRTTIAVAHSLATVRDADRLVVVADGELVEAGAHEELLAADGAYADLWSVHVGKGGTKAVRSAGGDDDD